MMWGEFNLGRSEVPSKKLTIRLRSEGGGGWAEVF